MTSKYYVHFKFRTGQSFFINPEKVVVTKAQKSPDNQLYIDGVPVANVGRGSPNFDANNDYYLYNCRPMPALFEMLPDDWDKTNTSLKVLDEIFVRTKKAV